MLLTLEASQNIHEERPVPTWFNPWHASIILDQQVWPVTPSTKHADAVNSVAKACYAETRPIYLTTSPIPSPWKSRPYSLRFRLSCYHWKSALQALHFQRQTWSIHQVQIRSNWNQESLCCFQWRELLRMKRERLVSLPEWVHHQQSMFGPWSDTGQQHLRWKSEDFIVRVGGAIAGLKGLVTEDMMSAVADGAKEIGFAATVITPPGVSFWTLITYALPESRVSVWGPIVRIGGEAAGLHGIVWTPISKVDANGGRETGVPTTVIAPPGVAKAAERLPAIRAVGKGCGDNGVRNAEISPLEPRRLMKLGNNSSLRKS